MSKKPKLARVTKSKIRTQAKFRFETKRDESTINGLIIYSFDWRSERRGIISAFAIPSTSLQSRSA
jgi:hypothetical protein